MTVKTKTPSFSGYVTKANLECSDGRIIMSDAFKHQDGAKVPLVYQHNHKDAMQVLGHVVLTHKDDGIWGDAFVNENTTQGKNAAELVKHGDIDKFSIWAKNLIEQGRNVKKGDIQEVSLVLAGANPGALITERALEHSGYDEDDEFVIVTHEIKHAEPPADPPADETAGGTERTIGDVLDTLNDEQKIAVNQVIEDVVAEAVAEAQTEAAMQHDALNSQEENGMTRNVFDQSAVSEPKLPQLKHADQQAFLKAALDGKVDSLKDFVRAQGNELMHAGDYGIDNIEVLFPDAQALMRTPTFVDRRQDWVKKFMAGTSKSPFSRVKTVYADITADEARAKGYIKANQKTEEVFPVFKRTTGPTMVYKKQKLDRQDIIDVTDFDVVAWLKAEMRGKLDEEIARAGLFGDGRAADSDDKIQEPTGNSGDGIRSIVNDHELYAETIGVDLPASPAGDEWNTLIDAATLNRESYMGSGNITAFMTYGTAAALLTIRDEFGHRMYKNLSELAGDMDVNEIVRIPTSLWSDTDILMILVDLSDYNFGANAGGQVTLFDDFDIDFNQYKYLMETYLSGALTLPYSAQIYRRNAAGGTVAIAVPAFVDNEDGTGTITIPADVEGRVYTINGQPQVDGDVVTINKSTVIKVKAESGYTLAAGTSTWTYTPTGG
jgi:HK97 family phage prohead protease